MIKHWKFLLFFFGLIMLGGCSGSTYHQKITTSLEPKNTSIAEVATASIPPEDIFTHYLGFPECQVKNDQEHASISLLSNGAIIYQNDDLGGLYVVGGSSIDGSQILSDDYTSIVFGFSPDGNWLAYSPFGSNSDKDFYSLRVTLLSADGHKKENALSTKELALELDENHRFDGINLHSYWINNDIIYVELIVDEMSGLNNAIIPELRPKVLNPFTQKWENQYLLLPGRDTGGNFGISPDQRMVLYEEHGLSLWDYGSNKNLWRNLFSTDMTLSQIAWSPDSSKVAYVVPDGEIEKNKAVILTKDGSIAPLLDDTDPAPGLVFEGLGWSPNGQYLALALKEEDNLVVFIYDSGIGKYVSQCIVSKFSHPYPSLVWSPDNQQIAISQIGSPILIYDIASGEIFDLFQHGIVKGWSDKFPIDWP